MSETKILTNFQASIRGMRYGQEAELSALLMGIAEDLRENGELWQEEVVREAMRLCGVAVERSETINVWWEKLTKLRSKVRRLQKQLREK